MPNLRYIIIYLLPLIPRHTACWCSMRFSFAFFPCIGVFGLVFCCCAIGFLSCFTLRPKYPHLFDLPFYPQYTCKLVPGLRLALVCTDLWSHSGVMVCMEQKSRF